MVVTSYLRVLKRLINMKSNKGRLTAENLSPQKLTEHVTHTHTHKIMNSYNRSLNKRQSKMKTKADPPVPRCIASRQLHVSGAGVSRKAHSHLAPVALLHKGKMGKWRRDPQVPSSQHLPFFIKRNPLFCSRATPPL